MQKVCILQILPVKKLFKIMIQDKNKYSYFDGFTVTGPLLDLRRKVRYRPDSLQSATSGLFGTSNH